MKKLQLLLITSIGLIGVIQAQNDQQRRQNEEYKRLSEATNRAFTVPNRTYTPPAYKSSVSSSNSSGNSSSSYKSSSSSYNNTNSGTYSAYAESFARKQQQYELQEKQREELSKQRMAARIEREAAIDAAIENDRKNEVRLIAERKALVIAQEEWAKANHSNPYATLEPIFTKGNPQVLYREYKKRTYTSGNFYYSDNRAALQAARMAWDGIGTDDGKRNTSEAMTYMLKSIDCGLKFCIGAEILESKMQENSDFLNAAVNGYKTATRYPDTVGQNRAFLNLYRLYSTKKFPIGTSPTDGSWATEVYLWARNNNLPGAADNLSNLMNERNAELPQYPGFILADLANIYSITEKGQTDAALLLWSYVGDAYEREGTSITTSPYQKVFETNGGLEQLRTLMMAKLHTQIVNGLSTNGLTTAQVAACAKAWVLYNNTIENAFKNGYTIKSSDALTLFNFYNSNNTKAANDEKVQLFAEILAKNGEVKPLTQAAETHRFAKFGWPQNDSKAFAIFKKITQYLPENTESEKKSKALKLKEIADQFKDEKKLGLPVVPAYQEYFIEKAVLLDADYTNTLMMHYMINSKNKANLEKRLAWIKKGIVYNEDIINKSKKDGTDVGISDIYFNLLTDHLKAITK